MKISAGLNFLVDSYYQYHTVAYKLLIYHKMKFLKQINGIGIGFIVVGVGLAVLNFLNFRSLWLDEALLALNIVNKSTMELLQPLDYNQVAPIGFLLVEKCFATLFGNADWSLRIFPLLSFFISVFLLFSITSKLLQSKLIALYTTAFFVSTFIVLSYSTEVKQYITDIAFALLILLGSITYNNNGLKNKWWIYALIGVISVWFSNVAILLLFSGGIYSIYKTYYSFDKKYLRLGIVLGCWMISFLVYFIFFIYDHPTKSGMVNFWQEAGAFLPKDIFSFDFYETLFFKIGLLFKFSGYSSFSLVLLPIFLLGLYYLGKNKKGMLFLLIFPLILHLCLSYFKMYPFDKRLVLYLYPFLLIIIFSGFYYIISFTKANNQKWLYILPILIVTNVVLLFRSGFPVEKEEIYESMSYLDSNYKNGDDLYVYYGANHAFDFYKKSFNFFSELDSSNIFISYDSRTNWSDYQQPVLGLDNSVWILFSHVYWIKNADGLTEDEFILNIFKKNGYQIIDEQKYCGSSIHHAIKTSPSRKL